MKKVPRQHTLRLEKIVGGGQALGTLDDGRKAFVWGGLPGELVTTRETKRKSSFVEGVVVEVLEKSPDRIEPLDSDNYLSTSPWQIMTFEAEQHYKSALIEEAFELHDIVLPNPIEMYSDGEIVHYRNKVEFSWYSEQSEKAASVSSTSSRPSVPEGSAFPAELDQDKSYQRSSEPDGIEGSEAVRVETLDLAFFRRGSKGKIKVDSMSLLPDPMMNLARKIRDYLRTKNVTARQLKTLLIRCDQHGNCVWQLYVKDRGFDAISADEAAAFGAQGGEVIYSDPRSPASRITKRLFSVGDIVLSDTILDVPFRYATEGFFQVNIPVYERALRDMQAWVSGPQPSDSEGSAFPAELEQDESNKRSSGPDGNDGREALRSSISTIDLYSGVGSIGLTIGGDNCTLIEIDENAVREMKRNIAELGSNAKAVLAPAEKALDYINGNSIIIVDPPRAGMHSDVVAKLLETQPPRIIYLSCNPVTQARDVALLLAKYKIVHHHGYNFFPRTPHIEHLVVLDNIQRLNKRSERRAVTLSE